MNKKAVIDQLLSEAEANYSASRWEDSAKTYEHLVGLAQDNNDIALAINFALYAIRSWSHMKNKNDRIAKLYQVVGILGLKKAAISFENLAKKLEESDDKKDAAAKYELAADGYSYIMSFEKAKKCFIKAAEFFKQVGSNEKDIENAIHLFERTSKIFDKLLKIVDRIIIEQGSKLTEVELKQLKKEKTNFSKSFVGTKKTMAELHIKLAEKYENNKDYIPVALKEYRFAKEIYSMLGEEKTAGKIKAKITALEKKG